MRIGRTLLIILILAFALRISGMFFGLPHADVFGDEMSNTITSFRVLDNQSLILPFSAKAYLPPLFSYLLATVNGLIGVIGIALGKFAGIAGFKEFVILYKEWFLAPSRIIAALFGVGTVYLTYLLAKKIFSEKIALLSAFLLAINFLHVHETGIGHIWSPLVFFAVFSAHASYCLYLTGERKWYLLSSFSLGLGYAIGQINIIFYPFFLLAHIFYIRKNQDKFFSKKFVEANFWTLGLVFLFTALNFYTIYKHFYDVILAVFKIVGLGEAVVSFFPRAIPQTAQNFSLWYNFVFVIKTLFYTSPIVFIFSLLGITVLLKKFKKDFSNIILIGFPVFTLLVFFFIFYHFPSRYVLPLIPFISIIASYFVFWLYENLYPKKSFLVFLVVLVSAYSLLSSVFYSYLLLKPYTVSSGVDWVYENVPSGSRVVSDIYLTNNKESVEFLKKYNEYDWLDTRKLYLSKVDFSTYPNPNYFVIDNNLTDVFSLPEEEKRADYAIVFFYDKEGKEGEIKKNDILNVFGERKKVASFYPKGEKGATESLLNLGAHFFLKNILETRNLGPNVEIYKFTNK